METIRILRNAHHILGLPTGIDLKSIRNKANHLLQLARIEEFELYDIDLPGAFQLRTEENIKKSLERLTLVKTRLLESFFWFETPTLQDYATLKMLVSGDTSKAINYWNSLSSSSPNWIAKKNEALALLVSIYYTRSIKDFEQSLIRWKEISNSTNFWFFYQENYKLTDDLGTDDNSFAEIRFNLFEYLSWLVLDLYRQNEEPQLIQKFYEQTGIIGKGLEDHIIAPIIVNITSDLDSLEKEDHEIIKLRNAKLAIEQKFENLSRFGADEYPLIKNIREQCAIKFRSVAIALLNDSYNYFSLSKEFLEAGISFSSSESYLQQAKNDKALYDCPF